MRIVHICTYDHFGGAAIAAFRLNMALRQASHESIMLVKKKYSSDPFVYGVTPEKYDGRSIIGRFWGQSFKVI